MHHRAWISGWDLHSKFRNPVKETLWWETPALAMNEKFLVFLYVCMKFYLYETKLPFLKSSQIFHVMLVNFLMFMEISYCQLKVIVFQFYLELGIFRLENLELSCGISNFCQNNSKLVFMLNNWGFKKYQLQGKSSYSSN